ncbi:MAG: 2-succinyl-6-hydroxy-2,4-cyclohexadiene-1-carboxylate synthase [Ardenticatenaceae bacterium]|nr:2-succinyl-6-hydroxy-2,4-cyclohexadiene-1-carboxylate synthase [Ardenticatenaceae bacterium]
MPVQRLNNINYTYEIMGSGPPVLLLHGFTGSRENWRTALPQLAADYRVIAVDLLGHGLTDAPDDPQRYCMERAADDIMALCASLETGPVHLLGYSMGARLALYTGVFHLQQIRSLVLESGSPGLAIESAREQRQETDEALAARIEREGIEAFVDHWETLPLWKSQSKLDPAIRAELRAQRLQNRPRGLANSLRGMGTGVQPSLWLRLAQLHRPTLLVVGQRDSKFVAINKQMSVSIPRCHYEIVSGAGHTVHLEKPQVFWSLVRHFWGEGSAVDQ